VGKTLPCVEECIYSMGPFSEAMCDVCRLPSGWSLKISLSYKKTTAMDAVDTLNILVIVTALMIVFTYWKTITSQYIRKDQKIMICILTIIVPIVGFILYFIYNNKGKAATT
jgi:hypothetical protein